jgi:23S rRNA (guanine2445-N2)-methyltransferase / 23S rRNA (guanine2069-N7)-methyltransferase
MDHHFFVTAAKGLEPLLRDELAGLGIPDLLEGKGGVSFSGGLDLGYRVCLWSRVANRVLLKLDSFRCLSPENLYAGIRKTDWSQHMGPDSSFAVNFAGSIPEIRNSHFAALKVKDAIVDQFRAHCGLRPNVATEEPDLRVQVHLSKNIAVLYLDLSGDSLHKRGYRIHGGDAPLKENLAAAVLIRAGWPEICARDGDFLDPMCGSGTLLIEAAMIAGEIAPGLKRHYFGFLGWKGHLPKIWDALHEDAVRRGRECQSRIPQITGYDLDPRAIRIASENIRNAGLQDIIRIEHRSIDEIPVPQTDQNPGLIAVNPPYGERITPDQGLEALYSSFGQVLKSGFTAWRVAMLIQNAELGFRIGIRSRRPYTLYNGPIECKLLIFDVDPERFFTPKSVAMQ